MCCGIISSNCATIEKTGFDAVCEDIILEKMCFMKLVNPQNLEINFLSTYNKYRDEILYISLTDGSTLKQLSSEIFTAYKNLQVLILEGAETKEIVPDTFKDAQNLIHLSLEDNQISLLESSTFNGVEKLESLDLSFNQLENLPIGVFQNLTNLKELLLNGNNIKSFDETTFFSLTHLSILSLGNKISEISPKLFSQNHEIVYLELNKNELTNDVYEAIKHLNKLKFLDLSENNLTELIDYPDSVEYLYVTDNKITKIFINENVVKLRASGNPFEEISGKSYDKLTEFYLDVEVMLKNFGEIDKYINLKLLGNETDAMYFNNVVRSFLRTQVSLLEI